ncbi:heavy-metal-associated domain-containing protein [Streptomyces sp. tea 10]|nr:heavy-metal-associated domain-containing protein [Streptomyces sp. tea 10]
MTTDLTVGGMTCAACVRRVEKKLGRLDGVTATVNPATGRARVRHPPQIAPEELVVAVEKAGYTAALPQPPEEHEGEKGHEGDGDDEDVDARREENRLLVTALLAVPVLVPSMVPAPTCTRVPWPPYRMPTARRPPSTVSASRSTCR